MSHPKFDDFSLGDGFVHDNWWELQHSPQLCVKPQTEMANKQTSVENIISCIS